MCNVYDATNSRVRRTYVCVCYRIYGSNGVAPNRTVNRLNLNRNAIEHSRMQPVVNSSCHFICDGIVNSDNAFAYTAVIHDFMDLPVKYYDFSLRIAIVCWLRMCFEFCWRPVSVFRHHTKLLHSSKRWEWISIVFLVAHHNYIHFFPAMCSWSSHLLLNAV